MIMWQPNNTRKLITLIEWIKDTYTFKYGLTIQTINTLLRYIRMVQNKVYIAHRMYPDIKNVLLSLAVAAEYIVPCDRGRVRNNLNILVRYLTNTYPEKNTKKTMNRAIITKQLINL